jgi:cystathionine beta-lyase
MWVADMDFRIPNAIREAFVKLVDHGIYGYHIKTEKYYKAITEWFQSRHNYSIDLKGIFFTPGVVPALSYLIQAFTEKGDGVIVQPPVYYPFFSVVQQNDRKLILNQLIEKDNLYSIDYDDLEKKAKISKMLILCNPHNPVGRVWKRDELLKVAEICLKNKIILVSDEIHNDLVFKPHRHIPIASLSPEIDNITITCHSASKTFNLAGLSTAYAFTRNPEWQKIFKKYISTLQVESLNTFGLNAMIAAYGQCGPWLAELLEYLKNNYDFIKEYLSVDLPMLKLSPLEATYLLWIDFRNLRLSDNELKEFIIHKAGLGLNDGPMFGTGGQGFQRMNIACPRQLIKEALDKLKPAVLSITF